MSGREKIRPLISVRQNQQRPSVLPMTGPEEGGSGVGGVTLVDSNSGIDVEYDGTK